MNLIPLPVIPIQIQLPGGKNSNSWIEWRPILKFRIFSWKLTIVTMGTKVVQ